MDTASAEVPALLEEVLSAYKSQNKLELLLEEVQNHFYVKPFKIKKVSYRQAIFSYSKLVKRYSIKELEVLPLEWHKNERKIFIWFIVCYWHLKKIKIQELNDNVWEHFGQIFFKKDFLFVKFQALSIIRIQKRTVWSKEDDNYLLHFIKELKVGNWNQISKGIFFANRRAKFIPPKQCRERWFNHKNENVLKTEWAKDEDFNLLYFTKVIGKRWSKFCKYYKNKRTEHMIKNRYYCLVNKMMKTKDISEENALLWSIELTCQELSQQVIESIKKKVHDYEVEQKNQQQKKQFSQSDRVMRITFPSLLSRKQSQKDQEFVQNQSQRYFSNSQEKKVIKEEKSYQQPRYPQQYEPYPYEAYPPPPFYYYPYMDYYDHMYHEHYLQHYRPERYPYQNDTNIKRQQN